MSEVISIGAIVIFFLLIFYQTIGSLVEHYKWIFGHEASFTVIMGKSIINKSLSFYFQNIYILGMLFSYC